MRPVRDFRCDRCGVLMKGVRAGDEIRATNRPYTDDRVERCTCTDCIQKSHKTATQGEP